MAVIGSIRKRSSLLVIIIGVALAAFILGDFAKRSPKRSVNIGSVEGEEITSMDFFRKVEQNVENTQQQQQKERLNAQEVFSVKEQTWQQMVRMLIMQGQYDELGIKVTTDELFDLVQGANPHPIIKQYFTNPQTGIFDRAAVLNYLKNLDNVDPSGKAQWLQIESYIKEDRLMQKYNNLVSKAYYVPEVLAKMAYAQDNDQAKIEYVAVKYSDVSDSLINVTDADYQKYYDKNKYRYEQENARDIDYVVFNVRPSQEDMGAATKEMEAVYNEFKETKNPISFVNANSDKSYDSTWRKEGQLPVEIDSLMFNSEVGYVSEPFRNGYTFHMGRLIETSMRPDSMKATHILIAYAGAMRANPEITRTALQAKLLADSLLAVVKKHPSKIEQLAKTFSDDGSVKKNSGDLGWFADGAMVTSFNNAVYNTKEGGVTLTESPFGFHVIKVTGKKDISKKVRVAMIDYEVIPSSETYQKIFANASKLASENHTKEEFDAYVKENRLNKRTAPKVLEMSNNIAGIPNARQVIRWSFNEEVEEGDVSDVFDLEGMFMVATVVKQYEKGYPALDEVKNRMKIFVTNEKKGEYLTQKMKAYNGDFDKIAKDLGGISDEVANLTFSSRNIKKFGRENKVIGTVFAQSNGTTLEPIAGVGGAFVVKVDNITKAATPANLDFTKGKLTSALERRVSQDYIYTAIKEVSEIEDYRIMYY